MDSILVSRQVFPQVGALDEASTIISATSGISSCGTHVPYSQKREIHLPITQAEPLIPSRHLAIQRPCPKLHESLRSSFFLIHAHQSSNHEPHS